MLIICRNGRLVNDILAVQRELSFFPEDFLQFFVWHYLGAKVWQEVQDLTAEQLQRLQADNWRVRPLCLFALSTLACSMQRRCA